MLASHPLSPNGLQNLNVLADAAAMLPNEQQQQGQLKKINVLAAVAATLLNGQQQSHLKQQSQTKKKKTNVLGDTAVTLLNRKPQGQKKKKTNVKKSSMKKKKRPAPPAPLRVQQQQKFDVLGDATVTQLNGQQQSHLKQQGKQRKKKTNVLADATATLLNEEQQSRRKQQGQKKKKKTNVKKSSSKKRKRPSAPAPLRVQQQRAPASWLLQLVEERGGMRPPAFLCSKRLTISDTNRNLNRFAIPRNVVHDVLYPLMNEEEQKQVCNTGERVGGGGMRVQCHDSLGSSSLCFKFWHSNSMFLFNDGWKLVVERNGLRSEKDVVEIWCFRDASMVLHFAFCIVREEEEGNVAVVVGEEGEQKEEEENGVAADGAVSLEREAINAANEDNIASVVQKKEEKKIEEENKDCLRRACKKRRITYP